MNLFVWLRFAVILATIVSNAVLFGDDDAEEAGAHRPPPADKPEQAIPNAMFDERVFGKPFDPAVARGQIATILSNRIEALALPCPNITDAGVVHLEGLHQLTNLRLYDTRVSDNSIDRLRGLTNLSLLDLRRTKVTAEGIERLRSMPRLQHLEGP